jgi:hypothetical protein
MALRLALVDDTDGRFNVPAPSLPAGICPDELQMVVNFYNDCLGKYLEKAPQYGKSWQRQGAMGNLSRIMSKTARLENMFWGLGKDDFVGITGEGADDSLVDLPNLCAFMQANLMMGNSHGKR